MIYWLSFAGEEGNRGVIITEADDFLLAIKRVNDLNINPHGEVQGFEMTKEMLAQEGIDFPRDILITPKQMQDWGYRTRKI